MKRRLWLVVLVLFVACDEPPNVRKAKQPGDTLLQVYVIDAPTGKCVQIDNSMDPTRFTVVEDARCSRQ